MKYTPEYRCWVGMLARCCNPHHRAFRNYGGRGIAVCARWRNSYEAFLADMGSRPSTAHSLDRYPDNDGDYEPGNCRWATREQQARNKRTNINITIGDETKCLTEWAKANGISVPLAHWRVKSGWPPVEAVTAPPTGMRRHGG